MGIVTIQKLQFQTVHGSNVAAGRISLFQSKEVVYFNFIISLFYPDYFFSIKEKWHFL